MSLSEGKHEEYPARADTKRHEVNTRLSCLLREQESLWNCCFSSFVNEPQQDEIHEAVPKKYHS